MFYHVCQCIEHTSEGMPGNLLQVPQFQIALHWLPNEGHLTNISVEIVICYSCLLLFEPNAEQLRAN
jgi:hypothetical protein